MIAHEGFLRFDFGADTHRAVPPSRILLLKDGDVAWKGMAGVKLDAASAKRIIDAFKKQGNELVIDYHHSTIRPPTDAHQTAPAAGWIKGLEYVPGEGLYADPVDWTQKAAAFIVAEEYKYYSPVIGQDEDTGQILDLQSVALTNVPRTKNLPALLEAAELLAAELKGYADMAEPKKKKKTAAEVDASAQDEETTEEEVTIDSVIAELAATLADAGVELADDADGIAVVQAAIGHIAGGAAESEEGEDTKTVETVATELGAKDYTMKGVRTSIAELQAKAARHDDLEKTVAKLEGERKAQRVKVLMGEQIERGVLNPHDEKAMAAARKLAGSDEETFSAVYGAMTPIITAGSEVDTSKSHTGRATVIAAAEKEFKDDASGASLRFYLNEALSEKDLDPLTDAEFTKLEGGKE